MYYRRNTFSSISGGIVLIGLALAFLLGRGSFFLPIFFVALAFSALFGSLSSGNPRAVYGGLQGFFWLLGLAFCFLVGFWPWILVVAGISIILGALIQPILAGLLGIGFIAAMQSNRQPQQQYQQPYQPYQQGYQTPPTYVEGEQQYQYPPQPKQEYDQPQAQYPQEMPPQQQ